MAEPSTDNVISCSIEETNALRLKLGLKPLAVGDTKDSNEHIPAKIEPSNPGIADEDDENVQARKRLIEGESVADILARGGSLSPLGASEEPNEDDGGYSSLDVKAWSKRMSNLRARNKVGVLNYSDDEDNDPMPKTVEKLPRDTAVPKLKVLHKVDELALDTGKEVVLTLADVGVLEAEDAGVAEVNFLEQPDIAARKPSKNKNQGGVPQEYNAYDEDNDIDDMTQGQRDILHKYDKAVEEYQGATLANMASSKQGFYLNLNENEEHKKVIETMLTKPTEESFEFGNFQRKKSILKNREKQVNWNKVFGTTSSSTGNKEDIEKDNEPISQIVKRTVMDMDDLEECNMLYNKLAKHRSRVLATVKDEPVEPVKTSIIDTGGLQTQSAGFHINATSELVKAVKPMHNSGPVDKPTSTKWQNDALENTEAQVDYPEGSLDYDEPMTTGIAGALAYLKDKGDIIEKKKDLEGVGNDITLQYFDEYGRKMTPKEAFRQLSWKFHGKGPGLNKRERIIKRIEKGKSVLVLHIVT
eukprot:XP_001611920.1 hypothetical protein [Babesia bovis T2Bo]